MPPRWPRFLAVARPRWPTSRSAQVVVASDDLSDRQATSRLELGRFARLARARNAVGSRGARSACCARCPAPWRPASGCRRVRPARAGCVRFSSSTTPVGAVGRALPFAETPASPDTALAVAARRHRRRHRKRDRIGRHGLDGQVLGQDLRPVAQQQRALDDVAQLAHVARPRVRPRAAPRGLRRDRRAPAVARLARELRQRTIAPAAGSRCGARAAAGCAA